MSLIDWIDAKTACQLLGVRPQTLYAYVSRGFLRASSDPIDPRRSLYAKLDVDQLAQKHRRPRARSDVAAQAIRWGDPVLRTSISGVRDGVLWFGARTAVDCATDMTLEDVAAHHCKVEVGVVPLFEPFQSLGGQLKNGLAFLAHRAAGDPSTLGKDRRELAAVGAALLSETVNAMLGLSTTTAVHSRVGTVWGLDAPATDLLRKALVVMSDHELNPSTFAVRVCAATGASLSAALLAGLATLSGPRHGGVADRARKTIEAEISGDAAFLRKAEAAPYLHGFGHPLYPAGDVRATYLLNALPPDAAAVQSTEAIAARLQIRPNIDVALAAFAMTHDLPRDAAFSIFAVGRLAGWIAHAIEQIETGDLIRPRADFTVLSIPS